MNGDPCERKYGDEAAPNYVPDRPTFPKFVASGRCALLDSGDGKRKDFVQDVENDENDQHDDKLKTRSKDNALNRL
jgi:hypothetical protein